MRIDNTIRTKITKLANISKISTINSNISININSKHEGIAKTKIAKHRAAKTMNINIEMNTKHEKEAKSAATNIRKKII